MYGIILSTSSTTSDSASNKKKILFLRVLENMWNLKEIEDLSNIIQAHFNFAI